jgi:rhamnose transport system permease protein
MLIITIIIGMSLSPYFADIEFLFSAGTMYVELGIIALSMTFVIITGQIDLSIAGLMAFVGSITAKAYESGLSMIASVIIGLALGLICGFFNGILVAILKLPAIIVTIGTLALYRGLAQVLIGEHSLSGFPESFLGIDKKIFFGTGIPMSIMVFIILAAILTVILNFSVLGRRIYALGVNETVARYSAIPVNQTLLIVFSLNGVFAALGGIMTISRLAVARYDIAQGGELLVIIIVLLGGTDINGGRGNMYGTIIAFFLMVSIRTGMNLASIQAEYQSTVMGALLIGSTLLPKLFVYIQSRAEEKANIISQIADVPGAKTTPNEKQGE